MPLSEPGAGAPQFPRSVDVAIIAPVITARGNAMSIESATSLIRSKASMSASLGYRVQFDLGPDGIIFWDGTRTPPVIDNEPREADTVLSLSLANLEALIAGGLNPTMAYMTGKLKIQGSMGVALKIATLLEE